LFGDIGGEFSSKRTFVEVIPDVRQVMTGSVAGSCPGTWQSFTESYIGPVWPTIPDAFPPFANSGDAGLLSWGTKAIAACKPTNPTVSLSTALGEILHEGIPKPTGIATWESRTSAAKTAGSEYLNLEFGWEPIKSDVNDFANAVVNAGRILAQFERDSGKLVRRRFEFDPLESHVVQRVNNNVSPYANVSLFDGNQNKGKIIVIRDTTIRRWFSGAFTYHIPRGNTTSGMMRRGVAESNRLLGISLTPDTLWNLAPWSWAVDWFTNAGDVISNLSDWAIDNLVLKYGYIMEHTVNRDTYTFSGPTGFAGGGRPSTIVVTSETKRRLKATPYGFGLTWTGFTPRQLAIIAALGITRS
jgi:hypothetical protein